MIKERIIEKAADGSSFSVNAVTMIYEDMDGHNLTFFISPEGLYDEVHKGVVKMSQTDTGDISKLAPEQRILKEQLVKVIKAGVKGIFMMYGDRLMTLFYGGPNHPRPPKDKKLDLVNWYLAELTKILIANMMKNDIVLKGQYVHYTVNDIANGVINNGVISIDAVSTRPVPAFSQGASDDRHESSTD